MISIILCLLPFLIGTQKTQAKEHEVIIRFSNLKSNDGKVALAVYRSEDIFLSLAPFRDYTASLKSENLDMSLTLPSGTFAISLFHDENSNNEMDRSMLGLPLEGFGFSNNVMGLFGPPSFDKASFKIVGDTILNIQIKNM
jgi:uncharacterized protein (DUF2141 family)